MEKLNTLQALSIRLVDTVEELGLVKDLEEKVWAEDDPIPVHQTVTAVKNGGLVLGAFLEERLIGFQYSFAGFDGKQAYLCSHTLGIDPDFRGRGIGEKLKLAQRVEAARKGYDRVTWTYDPLETANGNLNIRKLGAICSQYWENCYGEMTDILNAGIPSDRFQVEWLITSEHVTNALNKNRPELEEIALLPKLMQITTNKFGYAAPKEPNLHFGQVDSKLLVPVPTDFQKLKELDMSLAIEWRLKTRRVFTHYFEQGWSIVDFVKNESSEPVHYYVLQKIHLVSGLRRRL